MDNLGALVGILNSITATVGRISKKTSRYKTHHILIITKILVVNKTNIMLYWHEKKTINNPNENRGFSFFFFFLIGNQKYIINEKTKKKNKKSTSFS